jgi:hypothetical protein
MIKKVLAAALMVLAAQSGARATVLNLIPPPSNGNLSGDSSLGTVQFYTTDQQPTGTGYIRPFVRMQLNGSGTTEQGYNTDFRPVQFDEKQDAQYTHSLLLADLQIVTLGGNGSYYKFLLDANQTGSSPRISLADLQVYQGSDPDLTGFDPTTHTFSSGTSTLVYRLDTTVDNQIELAVQGNNGFDANHGSGSGDLYVYIPTSLFKYSGDYVYLYSKFDQPNEPNDGFEEWAAVTGNFVAPVPEHSTIALAVSGLAGLGIAGMRRFRRRATA